VLHWISRLLPNIQDLDLGLRLGLGLGLGYRLQRPENPTSPLDSPSDGEAEAGRILIWRPDSLWGLAREVTGRFPRAKSQADASKTSLVLGLGLDLGLGLGLGLGLDAGLWLGFGLGLGLGLGLG